MYQGVLFWFEKPEKKKKNRPISVFHIQKRSPYIWHHNTPLKTFGKNPPLTTFDKRQEGDQEKDLRRRTLYLDGILTTLSLDLLEYRNFYNNSSRDKIGDWLEDKQTLWQYVGNVRRPSNDKWYYEINKLGGAIFKNRLSLLRFRFA